MNTENGNSKSKNQTQNKIKVKHDFNEVSEGVEYIMTLKDKNVLEGDEEDLDVLENEILNQNKNLKLSEKRALEKEQDQYLKDQILAKYDDEDSKIKGFVIAHSENKKSKIKNSEINLALELDENQNPLESKKNFSKEELNSIKEKLKGLRSSKNAAANNNQQIVELNVDKIFSSDYLTEEEFKPKEFKKKKILNNKKIKIIDFSEQEGNGVDGAAIASQEEKKIKINTNEFYKSVEDEYDELNKFLEKQRNLFNKDKINEAPEEKIKNLILNTNKNAEIKNDNKINAKLDNSKDILKDLNSISVRDELNKENRLLATTSVGKKSKQDAKGKYNFFYSIFRKMKILNTIFLYLIFLIIDEILITETSEFLKQIPSKKDREDEIKTM